jgi:hypothetical protein
MHPLEGEPPHEEILSAEEYAFFSSSKDIFVVFDCLLGSLQALERNEEMVRLKRCILGIFYSCIEVQALCR